LRVEKEISHLEYRNHWHRGRRLVKNIGGEN